MQYSNYDIANVIDTTRFNTSLTKIPVISSNNADRICKELQHVIATNSKIFIYGDYDCDGMYSMLVWRDVFDCIGFSNYKLYQYTVWTHSIQTDIIEQVKEFNPEYVLICDTGSSVGDHIIIDRLRALCLTVLQIDHHSCEYSYTQLSKEIYCFNTYEERDILNGDTVSCGYASLLVANLLCTKYLHKPLSNMAKIYALASMYSDIVSMASDTAISLYNNIKSSLVNMPTMFNIFNKHRYKLCKRLFQFQINNRLNASFKSGNFYDINLITVLTKQFDLVSPVERIISKHQQIIKYVNFYIPRIERIKCNNIMLCVYELGEGDVFTELKNFTGLIASRISEQYKMPTVCLIKTDTYYKGSYRDYYNRALLDEFKLFCDCNGHRQAFGIQISSTKLEFFKKNLCAIDLRQTENNNSSKYICLSKNYIRSKEDIMVLSLYNEYMNVDSPVYIMDKVHNPILERQTKYAKFYNIGLPLQVRCTTPLIEGISLLIEPCICYDVELREAAL